MTNDVRHEEVLAEQAYLDAARADLAAMREAVMRLKPAAGDRVSNEYLKLALARRLRSLQDDPELPLYFGRIDLIDPAEIRYIGRRHVHDPQGEPVVVDWRADVSRPFYLATPRRPLGLRRRRRFGFQAGAITAIEDELLDEGQGVEGLSELVEAEIERPRTGPMRDIVATIQPDQDEIVRAALTEVVCVQGGPGTGKTAVGLHRAAYLLYAHAEKLRRTGVLIIGPNDAFIRYISQVLPALGEFDVEQRPLREVIGRSVRVRRTEDPAATLKHDARMAAVIDRHVVGHLVPIEEPLTADIDLTRVRLQPAALERIRRDVVQRSLPYAAGRKIFRERVVDELFRRVEHVHTSVTRGDVTRALRVGGAERALESAWPSLHPATAVIDLLTDRRAMAAAADGMLAPAEQDALMWDRKATRATAPWSAADLVLVDEAAGRIKHPDAYGHLVVDEAQDLSAMELRAIARRSRGSLTLLGDLAQAVTPWAPRSWDEVLQHLEVRAPRFELLTRAFRIPGSVLEMANRLLPWIAPTVPVPVPVRDSADALSVQTVDRGRLAEAIAAATVVAATRPGSTGVIVPPNLVEATGRALTGRALGWSGVDGIGGETRVTLLTASESKGLEFDSVVVGEPAGVVAEHPAIGLNLLYVAMTRAVMHLALVHAQPLPPELTDGLPS
jgi:DNA helicase IV